MQEIETVLRKLAPREEQILRLRFGIGTEARQLDEIGEGLGISAATVKQIQWRALQRLRSLALEDV